MVGRPTSDHLLDTNLIPFQVSTKLPILSHRQPDSLETFISMEPFLSCEVILHFDFEDWLNMQELLGFFLVANDETRRNVNSLIKVAANFNTHLKKLQICAEDAKTRRSLSLWWVWLSGSNQQHNQAERRSPCHWTSWVSPERQKDKGEHLKITKQIWQQNMPKNLTT